MRFATKLTSTVVLASLVIVPALGGAVFYFTRDIIQKNVATAQFRQTRGIFNIIDRTLYKAFQDVELISQGYQIESFFNSAEPPEDAIDASSLKHDLNNEIRLTGPWDLFSIIDIDGNIVYSSLNGNIGKNIKQYPVDSLAHYSALPGQRYYSDLVKSDLTGKHTIIFSMPIRENSTRKVIGTVVAHFSWPIILQILDNTHSSNKIQLFNRTGDVIATPSREKGNILNTSLSKVSLVNELFRGKRISSGVEILDAETGPVLATVISQPGYLGFRGREWGLVLTVPTSIAYAEVVNLARNISFIIIFAMLFIIITIYQLAKRIAKPIEQLKEATVAVGEGRYDHHIDITSGDEIEELSDSFSQMVDARKQADQQLHIAQSELIKQGRMATLGQLTATVSHELRNPIATMFISLDILRKKQPAAFELPAMDRMTRALERCDRIIDELLDYTRLQAHAVEPVLIDQYLKEFINELVVPKGIHISKELAAVNTAVNIDLDLFRRALVNITDNAFQALQDSISEKQLTISSKIKAGRCLVSIVDNGPGMSEETMGRMFEPLFSTKVYGVGLGMPVVQQVMTQLGGELDVESTLGQGTIVSLSLPLAEEIVEGSS